MHNGEFLVQTAKESPLIHGHWVGKLMLQFDSTLEPQTCLQTGLGSYSLASDWQALEARFGPFELNRYFVKQLITLRPKRIVIDALTAATADLARLSVAMGIHTKVLSVPTTVPTEKNAKRWFEGLMSSVNQIEDSKSAAAFGYANYALGQRNHSLLAQMHAPHAEHFEACRNVLDVGCGTGIFLDILARQGIAAEGVERNTESIRFARTLGLIVHEADALEFLSQHPAEFDGLYCSHFVEHLPIEAVDRLIQSCAESLLPNGVAVFTFPDPESIRSQLLGFWRDPEHVRFYHPDLIQTLAEVHGLSLEINSQNIPERTVGPFTMHPPILQQDQGRLKQGFWRQLMQRLGLVHQEDLELLKAENKHQTALIEKLWQVNQTWAWEDNVVLRFRKITS
jgi:O-antigen chain-terminating methyltransferase